MDKAIDEVLPHRYPFLLVDKVLKIVPGESIIAQKNVSYNEPFFTGHFPTEPIMPGVLIIESLAQAGALLAFETNQSTGASGLLYLAGIKDAKFKKKVVPGDILNLDVCFIKKRGSFLKMQGIARVADIVVATVELLSAMQ